MIVKKYQFIFFIAALITGSCHKIEQLPAIPYIEFTSFAVFDSVDILENHYKAGRLKFYFEDGDGDIGLEEPSGDQADTTNLFLTLFRKREGAMVQSLDSNDPLLPYTSYRIPYMERLGQNKILKGTISVTFSYQSYSPGDTIKYDFYIKDRALNQSNVASTCEIVVTSDSTYTN